MKKLICILLVLLCVSAPTFAAARDDHHMDWWREARFGMFIHWGLYSVAGGEWKGKDYGKEQGGPAPSG